MWIRDGLWIGGIVVVTAIGAVAAYSAVDPGFLPGLRGTTVSSAPGAVPMAAAEPVRRTSRLDGDMRATFERLERFSAPAAERPAPAASATERPTGEAARVPDQDGEPLVTIAPATVVPSAPAVAATPAPFAAPAKGMPVSLVPSQRPASAEAPRVMDPRLTRTLDLLGSAQPRAIVAAVPTSIPPMTDAPTIEAASTPTIIAPTIIAPTVAAPTLAANESDLTAEELNAREHQRIRRTLEGRAGGTN